MSNIVVKNLYVSYDDKTIFDNFNATFEENKISVILGESGVGKTTLLNSIASLIDYKGEIDGVDGGVSYIFQKDRLIPTISVFKNLDLILKGICKDRVKRRDRIEKIAKKLEIDDILSKRPSEISGGEAQRAAMARAFLYESDVLLLDEPFKALDTALKSRLIKELISLNKTNPRTVIFVTHAIDECLLCADNYYVLSSNPVRMIVSGSIKGDKENRRLTDSALEDVRAVLLNAITNGQN